MFRRTYVFPLFLTLGFLMIGDRSEAQNNLGQLFQGQPVVAKNDGISGATALSSPVYFDVTQFNPTSSDWCAKVSAAYQKAISVNSNNKGAVLDARGFAQGSNQFCASQPFAVSSGAPKAVWLMIGPYTIVTSVGWILPQDQHLITGTGDATGQNGPNTLIQACNGNCGANPNFPGTSIGGPTLNFTWPHGPGGVFPIGTYGSILYDGAGNGTH